MNKAISQTRFIINHPEEWDFRQVTEEVLHLAIRYEYARSATWIVDEFRGWHRQKVKLPRTSKSFRRWHGKTVGYVLRHIRRSADNIPQDVGEILAALQPDSFNHSPISEILDISWHFPIPFLWIPTEFNLNSLKHLASGTRCGLRILKGMPLYSKTQLESSAKAGIFYVAVEIDLKAGKKSFMKEAGRMFDKLETENPDSEKMLSGKANSASWNYLKELAAYRFAEAKWSSAATRGYVYEYQRQHPMVQAHSDVLPTYQQPAWSTALQSVSTRLRDWFPTQ